MVSHNRFLASISIGLSAVIAPLVVLQSALPAAAAGFSQIYAFGDSLTDTGNAFAQTGLPPVPYFDGHFANGPIWTEYLASDLGIPETSLGYGGALTDQSGLLFVNNVFVAQTPGTLAQVNTFVANRPKVDENALYIIWAGSNDYLAGQKTNPLEPVSNLVTAVSTLNAAGAKKFLLVNLPDLGNLPLFRLTGRPPEVIAGVNALSEGHNQALAATISTLNASSDIEVNLLDANRLIRSAISGNQGFGNTTDACILIPSCVTDPTEQSSYLFWDAVHPTTAAHRILANNALSLLEEQPASVPEPATVLGLILVGGLGFTQIKRKQPVS